MESVFMMLTHCRGHVAHIRHEGERRLQAVGLLHCSASTLTTHVPPFLQLVQMASESSAPVIRKLDSWMCWGYEVKLWISLMGTSGLTPAAALRAFDLEGVMRGGVCLWSFAAVCVSTALTAGSRPGQVKTGGRHALVHLNRNAPMRTGLWREPQGNSFYTCFDRLDSLNLCSYL